MSMKEWFGEPDYDPEADNMVSVIADVKEYETPKAVLFTFGGDKVWLPKSQIEYDSRGSFDVNIRLPQWLAVEKELDYDF